VPQPVCVVVSVCVCVCVLADFAFVFFVLCLYADACTLCREEDEDEAMLGQPKLTFAAASAGPRRCDFVRKLGLHAVVDDF
jgi:hypothetical protein